jgi:CRP-like cAMP-binding protein
MKPSVSVELFSTIPEPLTFELGETIFTQGTTGEVMYGIISGEIEMQVNGKVVETLVAGDVFGEGALVQEDHSRASTAVAKTPCTLAMIDRERFMFLVQNTPMFALDVILSLSNRLRSLKGSR